MLTDFEILLRIARKIKKIRLQQNITQQELAKNAGVSLSSVRRAEEGNIKSFDTFIRLLRSLGKMDIFSYLIEDDPMSPTEYYHFVNNTRKSQRMRASGSKSKNYKTKEEIEW